MSDAVLQRWRGFVTSVGEGEFSAVLIDATPDSDRTGSRDVATFATAEVVAEEEREFVVEGAGFTWTIPADGSSVVKFDPPGVWTAADLKLAGQLAEDWFFAVAEPTTDLPSTSWD
ncbi:hypothetical protein [Alienimonas sp. DA493]|uniref:hypothetical protein n=1 Tax=Alienimonas sp. DA493 TaxID=3373605 RepID=UPI00375491E4